MTDTEARPRRRSPPSAASAPGRAARTAKAPTAKRTKAGGSAAKVRRKAEDKTAAPAPAGQSAEAPARRSLPWAEIRSTYEDSSLPVAVIAKAYGVRERAIYERAQREAWAHRRGAGEGPEARTVAGQSGPERPGLDRSVLVSRLFRAVERQIDEIDKRLLQLQSDGVDERDARTLAALAKTLELLIGLERQTRPEVVDTPEADIDAFRRDLARRIQSLQATEGD